MSDFTRYIVPNGGGVAEHPSGLLYHRKDVDPVVDALRARIRELEAEQDNLLPWAVMGSVLVSSEDAVPEGLPMPDLTVDPLAVLAETEGE